MQSDKDGLGVLATTSEAVFQQRGERFGEIIVSISDGKVVSIKVQNVYQRKEIV